MEPSVQIQVLRTWHARLNALMHDPTLMQKSFSPSCEPLLNASIGSGVTSMYHQVWAYMNEILTDCFVSLDLIPSLGQ